MVDNRLSFVPLVTEACLAVVAEAGDDSEYFISRIDWLLKEQPFLFQKMIDSCHKMTTGVAESDSEEYAYIFTNSLCMAIQVYLVVDKQLGIKYLEE
jgi:hypothetical protein